MTIKEGNRRVFSLDDAITRLVRTTIFGGLPHSSSVPRPCHPCYQSETAACAFAQPGCRSYFALRLRRREMRHSDPCAVAPRDFVIAPRDNLHLPCLRSSNSRRRNACSSLRPSASSSGVSRRRTSSAGSPADRHDRMRQVA